MEMEWLGRVDYVEAWALQRQRHAQRVAGEIGDTILLLEHEPVYTAGKRTEPWERPLGGGGGGNGSADAIPVIDVDRGGRITWHGPGQLTGYPIVELPNPTDVVGHVRRLEAALLEVCDTFGVAATQVEGRSGVWTADGARKLAAIGIRVARGVTMHGFALNCDCNLTSFAAIVPCGITDAGVTSLTVEAGRSISVADVRPSVEAALRQCFNPRRRSANPLIR